MSRMFFVFIGLSFFFGLIYLASREFLKTDVSENEINFLFGLSILIAFVFATVYDRFTHKTTSGGSGSSIETQSLEEVEATLGSLRERIDRISIGYKGREYNLANSGWGRIYTEYRSTQRESAKMGFFAEFLQSISCRDNWHTNQTYLICLHLNDDSVQFITYHSLGKSGVFGGDQSFDEFVSNLTDFTVDDYRAKNSPWRILFLVSILVAVFIIVVVVYRY